MAGSPKKTKVGLNLDNNPISGVSTITGSGDLIIDTNVIYVDTANNRVGINKVPNRDFSVLGDGDFTGDLHFDNYIWHGSEDTLMFHKGSGIYTDFNLFLGYNAGSLGTSGTSNVAFGDFSGNSLITGSLNVSLGYASALHNETGSNNTLVGSQSFAFNFAGDNNTGVGYRALYYMSGSLNTALGASAGELGTTNTSTQCLMLGALARVSGNLTNATAIGYDSVVDASNTVVIGNSSITNTRIRAGNLTLGSVNGEGVGTFYSASMVSGTAGTSTGTKVFRGLTSGEVTLTVNDVAGTWTFTLPNSSGSSNQVLVTNGSGNTSWSTITNLSWNDVITTTESMLPNYGYVTNHASQVVLTLPTTSPFGSVIKVTGVGAGGWKIAQNSGNIIHYGTSDTTTGVTGYLESTDNRDSIELVCVVEDTEWNILSSVGTITVF